MPSKNSLKYFTEESFYHVYNRGVEKRVIFQDRDDYAYFIGLLKRHLSPKPAYDKQNREYRHLARETQLLAYCLMPNHFHLLLYNLKSSGVEQLMRTLATSYSMYFNKKNKRVGPLFQGVYKASEIISDPYLEHITRYIHRNPMDYKNYNYSSYKNYTDQRRQEWVVPDRILALFESVKEYVDFVEDYEMLTKEEKQDLKVEFANS